MGKVMGVQGQSCRYQCIQDTRTSEIQPLAFAGPFSRDVAGVGEGESGHPWLRAGVSLPRHLMGPGEAPKGAKMDERPGSTKPEEFRGVLMPLTHMPPLLDPSTG